jgi:hypothetical protein
MGCEAGFLFTESVKESVASVYEGAFEEESEL